MKALYSLIIIFFIITTNLLGIPFPNIPPLETDRLVLRQLTLDDVDDVFEFTSDPDVIHLTQMSELHTDKEKDTIPYIQRMINRYSTQDGIAAYWAIVSKEYNNKVIGIIGFFGYSIPNKRAEVGYLIAKNFWNQGFATEALKEVIRFGFNEMSLNRIQAGADPENYASIRVIEKNNMHLEGRLRDLLIVHGTPADRCIFSMLKREYKNI